MGLEVRPFPWQSLPRVERAAWLEQADLRRRLSAVLAAEAAPAVLGMLLGVSVSAELTASRALRRRERTNPARGIVLGFPASGLRLSARPEAELTRLCVARLLKQDFELGWPDAELDPALRGASAALLLEVARRSALAEGPELFCAAEPGGDWALELELTLRLEERAFRLTLECERLPSSGRAFEPRPPVALAALGSLPLAVPWVSAVFELSPRALAAAEVGDVWLPGAGWLAARPHTQAGLLAAPSSAWGLPVDASRGKIVLGAKAVHLHQEEPARMKEEPNAPAAQSIEPSALEQIVGDTPLVVRLEIGSLELSAREWAALSPGDVLQSGRRLDAPVVLRVMGQELAHGELVEIEGEIGVRITSLKPHRGGDAPARGGSGSPEQ